MGTFRLYKYLSIDDPQHWVYWRKLLVGRELYFSDPQGFNDPLDCALLDRGIANVYLKPFKAFCMSVDARNDALMFSHYGDSHRGFRLTFEVRDDITLGEATALELGQRVQYRAEVPTFNESNIHKMPYIKSKCWEYEAEYRVLKVTEQVLTYPEDCLVEVAFGYRMNADFEPVIRQWTQDGGHQRVRFVRAVPSATLIEFQYVDA